MAYLVKQLSTKLNSQALCHHLKYIISPNSKKLVRTFSQTFIRLNRRKFSDKHEWVVVDGKIGTVGVSNYAQEALGDVVYVQTPDVGLELKKDDEAGVIESVKAVNEIYSPVSGTVTEVNEALVDTPSLINKSCYDAGWIYKIELSDVTEIDDLMDEEAYDKYLKSID